MWIQASPVCASIVFESTNPFIQYFVNKIPAADLSSSTQGLFTALSFLGVSKKVVNWLKALLDDGVALLIAIAFLFTPGAIANVGVVIVALLLPAFKSSKLLGTQSYSITIGTPSKHTPLSTSYSSQYLTWLKYWMFLAILLVLREYNIAQLYPSTMMALTLWLQNTYFAGADMLLRYATGFWRDIEAYEKKKQADKKRQLEAATDLIEATTLDNSSTALTSLEGRECVATLPEKSVLQSSDQAQVQERIKCGMESDTGKCSSREEEKHVHRRRTSKKSDAKEGVVEEQRKSEPLLAGDERRVDSTQQQQEGEGIVEHEARELADLKSWKIDKAD